jgi:hypothetical protein
MSSIDEIIAAVKQATEEEPVTLDDYDLVADAVSVYLIENIEEWSNEELKAVTDRTDVVEDAMLAAAVDDEEVDVSQCILVLRGHKEPEEADLPVASMEAYHEAGARYDDEVQETIDELFRIIDGRE